MHPDDADETPAGEPGEAMGAAPPASISAPFIRRPIATSLIMLALMMVGIAAYPFLPVASLPDADIPTLQVSASYSGASPETMASAVATPLETQFAAIPGINQMTSVSTLGNTSITLQFDLDRSVDTAATDVQAAINAAGGQLPKDLPSPPSYRKINPADSPILLLSMESDSLPLTKVDDAAETIVAQQLSQIEGVGEVSIGGEQKPAVRIEVDPAKLAARGMTLEDVRGVLANATVDSPKGSVDGPDRSFTVADNDQMTEASQYQNVILAYRDGAPVRVRDIGRAVDGAQNRELAGWHGSKRDILLIVFKQPGANVIATADRIKAELPKLQASIPPQIKIVTVADRTLTIRASVNDVERTLGISIVLVVMVIFLFLRSAWATIIPSITVPLALLGTLAAMLVLGFSLDNLSLMALTIAVGFVVDDAIVMLENIFRYIEHGMSPFDAALKGASEIGFTILSITFSLIAVFIPLLAMGGIVGRLMREFAVTLTVAVLISGAISLTLTPMLCSRFLRHETRHGRMYRIIEAGFDGIVHFYERTLDVAMRFRFVTLMVFFATVLTTGVLYAIISKGFFPEQDNGILIGTSQGAQDSSYDSMVRHQRALAAVISADPNIQTFSSFVGTGGGQTANNGRMYITLKPWSQRSLSAQQVIDELRPKLAKVQGVELFLQAAQDIKVGGRASRTLYQYTLTDAKLDELSEWSPRVLAKLKTLNGLTDVATDQQDGGTMATLTIDRDRAARFGIQPQEIDDTLYDAFGQRQVTQYFTQTSSYYVIMEVAPSLAGKVDTLSELYVKSSSGAAVPLSSFVRWNTVKTGPLAVSHQSLFPAVTISFNLAPGVSLGTAVKTINAATSQMGLPASVQTGFAGTAQAFQSSLASEPYLIGAALLSVYIILGILYESFILPLTILSTLPSAGVGALLMLLITGNSLTVIALIGIILLIGIVKKNGIMMVDFAINAERREGKSPEEAIREAALLRFRPILMTTMSALLSGLPLMLASGAGGELRRPLGLTMVGGLLLSQVLTLYTTPVLYLYLDRLQHRLTDGRPASAGPRQRRRRRQAREYGAAD
jgi:HAE1 family hydrophobic/amphiphilic exporter-1